MFTIFLLTFTIFLLGCNQGDDNLAVYKGISSAEIPDKCLAYRGDVCELYDCMVPLCWCAPYPDAILLEGNTVILTEEEAMEYVEEQFDVEATGSAEINDVFFAVFVGDDGYTVAKDGTVIQIVCGV